MTEDKATITRRHSPAVKRGQGLPELNMTNGWRRLGIGLLVLLASFLVVHRGYGVGVLVLTAKIVPERIASGEQAHLSIESRDGFARPLGAVRIRITADSGYFEPTHKPIIQGITDENGRYRTLWHSDPAVKPGPREFKVIASKNGYIGRSPLTLKILVEESPDLHLDTPGPPVAPGAGPR
jgi:hypothetical protein